MVKKKVNRKRVTRKRVMGALGAGTMLVLGGIGAGYVAGRVATNLGVDLKGFEGIVPVATSFSVGGPIAGVASLILDRLPDFFGDRQVGGMGDSI